MYAGLKEPHLDQGLGCSITGTSWMVVGFIFLWITFEQHTAGQTLTVEELVNRSRRLLYELDSGWENHFLQLQYVLAEGMGEKDCWISTHCPISSKTWPYLKLSQWKKNIHFHYAGRQCTLDLPKGEK